MVVYCTNTWCNRTPSELRGIRSGIQRKVAFAEVLPYQPIMTLVPRGGQIVHFLFVPASKYPQLGCLSRMPMRLCGER